MIQELSIPANAADNGGLPGTAFVQKLHLTITILSQWLLIGLFVDGWSHNHTRTETFFSPWHLPLYTGLGATAIYLAYITLRYRLWQNRAPAGYSLAVIGTISFSLTGGLDLLWHQLFGVEATVEALVSPPHLLAAFGGTLIILAALRASLSYIQSTSQTLWRDYLPLSLGLFALMSEVTFFTQFAHPYTNVWAAKGPRVLHAISNGFTDSAVALGIASIMLQTLVYVVVFLTAIQRYKLPQGSLALIFTLNACFMSTQYDQFWVTPVALAAGLVAEALHLVYKKYRLNNTTLSIFSFVMPTTLWCFYFMALSTMTEGGTWWSIHLISGTTIVSGGIGAFLSPVFYTQSK